MYSSSQRGTHKKIMTALVCVCVCYLYIYRSRREFFVFSRNITSGWPSLFFFSLYSLFLSFPCLSPWFSFDFVLFREYAREETRGERVFIMKWNVCSYAMLAGCRPNYFLFYISCVCVLYTQQYFIVGPCGALLLWGEKKYLRNSGSFSRWPIACNERVYAKFCSRVWVSL